MKSTPLAAVLVLPLLWGCGDDLGSAAPFDPDEELRAALVLADTDDLDAFGARVEEVFAEVRESGRDPLDGPTLKRVQAALLPLGSDVVSPMMLVNTTLSLAAATDLVTARGPLVARVDRHPQSYAALLAMGHLALVAGFAEPAAMWLQRAIDAAPERLEALQTMGTLHAGEGRLEDALAVFDRVLAVDPGHPQARQGRGYTLEELGRLDEAVEEWRRLSQEDDGRIGAISSNRLGAMLMDRGDHEGALTAFLRAVELQPDSAMYPFNVGQLLYLMSRGDEGEPYLELASERSPEDPRPHFLLGQIDEDAGRDEPAETHFREALRLGPDDESVRYRLSQLLRRTGRGDEADRVAQGRAP